MKNSVQLITYANRLGGGGLRELHKLLRGALAGLFGGVHVLPFYDPIDGADTGFDPIDHTRVDPRIGQWSDIHAISRDVDIMADVIVNHVSCHSPQFLDFTRQGNASPYAGMFLTLDKVFPKGITPLEQSLIYRPRPGAPFTTHRLSDGSERLMWTTFTPQQIDIDVESPEGQAYLQNILGRLSDAGVKMIRLDAVGYAIKRAGTRCFMLPQTFNFIDQFAETARARGLEVLVEVHAHHQQQIAIAQRVDRVYDFALPPLLLHTLRTGNAAALKRWLAMRPTNAITVLDTHDGIGMVDIGADGENPGLVTPQELEALVDHIHSASGNTSRNATGTAASNLDLYQVNCTFFDALGRDGHAYLAARAIQFFVPGVPQVYYVGLLAGTNDTALLAATGIGRDINRQHFTPEQIDEQLRLPVVQHLMQLIRLRNSHPAFGGSFEMLPGTDSQLALQWSQGSARALFTMDLATRCAHLELTDTIIPSTLIEALQNPQAPQNPRTETT